MPLTTCARQPGYRFVFVGGRSQLVVEFDPLCEVNNLYSAQVGMIGSRSVYDKTPERQLHSTPIAVSGNAYELVPETHQIPPLGYNNRNT